MFEGIEAARAAAEKALELITDVSEGRKGFAAKIADGSVELFVISKAPAGSENSSGSGRS